MKLQTATVLALFSVLLLAALAITFTTARKTRPVAASKQQRAGVLSSLLNNQAALFYGYPHVHVHPNQVLFHVHSGGQLSHCHTQPQRR